MRVDIHQHLNMHGRSHEKLIEHQAQLGIDHTILLSGTEQNGLLCRVPDQKTGKEFCVEHKGFSFGANTDIHIGDIIFCLDEAAIVIGELKFPSRGNSVAVKAFAQAARYWKKPMLLHFEEGVGVSLDGFTETLASFPDVSFIGHGPGWWSDASRISEMLLEHENLYADISAKSAIKALAVDEDFTVKFFSEFRSRVLFGSDCQCKNDGGQVCIGKYMKNIVESLCAPDVVDLVMGENAQELFGL